MHQLKLPGTPPSINTVGGQSDWRTFHREKKKWEGYCMIALLEAKVPKELTAVYASAVLTFTSNRRRDEGNFRPLLEKALGDALQVGGYIDDDTPRYYSFHEVNFGPKAKVPITIVTLEEVPQCLCENEEIVCPRHGAG